MIVDCHVHIWQQPGDVGLTMTDAGEPRRKLAADVSDHMEATQSADVALAWGFASRRLGAEVDVAFLGQHMGLRTGRIVGIVGIDPADPAWRDKLAEAVDEWGFRGVTLCPAAQDLHPTDNRALALYEVCSERGLPVMFDLPAEWRPGATLAFARPELLDGVAREFPDLKIVVSGFGAPYVDETLVLLEKFPWVYTDTAHVASRPHALARAVARAHEAGVIDKVFFGSGFPLAWPRRVLAQLFDQCSAQRVPRELLVPRDAIQALVHGDALAALGIPRPEGFVERRIEPAEEEMADDH